jgi:hypothetical protein
MIVDLLAAWSQVADRARDCCVEIGNTERGAS